MVTLSASMTAIPQATFFMCSKLERVIIPASIKTVEYDAFEVCEKLSTIEFGGTRAQVVTFLYAYETK